MKETGGCELVFLDLPSVLLNVLVHVSVSARHLFFECGRPALTGVITVSAILSPSGRIYNAIKEGICGGVMCERSWGTFVEVVEVARRC